MGVLQKSLYGGQAYEKQFRFRKNPQFPDIKTWT
jgi:hypothetical protein